jgi:cellulose synthase/poly-beta-1,6-N-acetylglucosamine synthase-like glycosyltransferase
MKQDRTATFSIGVCASDSATNLPRLLGVIQQETFRPGFVLQRIVVVASGVPPSVISEVQRMGLSDSRILLIQEPERRGKTEAINKILSHNTGRFLILVNSDALPLRGSISRLVEEIGSREDVGSVSALPTFQSRDSTTAKILELMWSAHNISSVELNDAHLSNHNCDELMAFRSDLVGELPRGVINDGAYIGGLVYSKGYRVVFCADAKVLIDIPASVSDLVRQRRRILFGHAQVWKELGRPPRTIESLMLARPRLAIRFLTKVLTSRPGLFLVVPVAAVTEAAAGLLSIIDQTISPGRHMVWRRYGEG